MSVFHRLGHFLSTTLILYIQMDPPKGYLKESLSIADLKKKQTSTCCEEAQNQYPSLKIIEKSTYR